MKNKGFTLVELIAVIVILALITLIVVPKVKTSLTKSENKSRIISAQEFNRAIENQIIENINNNDPDIEEGTYTIDNLKKNYRFKYTGDSPVSGTVVIEDDKVFSCELVYEDYTVTCNNGNYTVNKN